MNRKAVLLLSLLVVSLAIVPPKVFGASDYEYNLEDADTDISLVGQNGLQDKHPSGSYTSAEGQAFRTNASWTSYTIGHIESYMDKPAGDNPVANLTCRIYACSGNVGSTGVPTGSALGSSVQVNSSIIGTSPSYISFNFSSSGVALEPNTNYTYAIEVTTDGIDTSDFIRQKIDLNAGHSGNRLRYTAGSWVAVSTNDAIFKIYSVNNSAPIYQNPFPSNGTTMSQGGSIELGAEVKDITGLDYAWLSTNETGSWKNYTIPLSYTYEIGEVVFVYGNDSTEETSPQDDIDPDLYQASNGTIVLIWTHQKATWERWYSKSDDDGLTWTSPQNFSDLVGIWDYDVMTKYGSVRRIGDSGKYFLCQKLENGSLWSAVSSDGWTWENATEIWGNRTGITAGLPMGFVNRSDSVFCVWTDYVGTKIYVNRSNDAVDSWVSHGEHTVGGSVRYGQMKQFENGTYILTWFNAGTNLIKRALSSNAVSFGSSTTLNPNEDYSRAFGFEILDRETEYSINSEYYSAFRDNAGDESMNIGLMFHYENDSWTNDNTTIDGYDSETEPHFLRYNRTHYLWAFRADGTNGSVGNDHDIYVFNMNFSFVGDIQPLDCEDAISWTWCNFTWTNSSLSFGTDVLWRIWFNDTIGNVNSTDIYYFSITGMEESFSLFENSGAYSSLGSSKALANSLFENPSLNELSTKALEIERINYPSFQVDSHLQFNQESQSTFYNSLSLHRILSMSKEKQFQLAAIIDPFSWVSFSKELAFLNFENLLLHSCSIVSFELQAAQEYFFTVFENPLFSSAVAHGKGLLFAFGELVSVVDNASAVVEGGLLDFAVTLVGNVVVWASVGQLGGTVVVSGFSDMEVVMIAFGLVMPWIAILLLLSKRKRVDATS